MEIKKIGDDITEIDGVVRIEPGPRRYTEIATLELLSNEITASHYHAPFQRQARTKDRKITFEGETYVVSEEGDPVVDEQGAPVMITHYAIDAIGRPIRLGEPMSFINWKQRKTDRTFYVYRKQVADDGVERFLLEGDRATYEEAMSLATTIAAAA